MAEDLMDKVFSLFSGEGLTDEKQNMLKGIAKELGQSKYAKFFRVRSEETDPSFSSFLFYVYKMIFPIKEFYKDIKKIAKLRTMIVESCIDADIQETVIRLSEANLNEKAKSTPPESLVASIQKDIELLSSQFNHDKISAANHRYELAGALEQLVKYNFLGFFKKFDPHFADGSFVIEPKFPAIKTILIVDQIGEFLTVTHLLKPEEDWVSLLALLKACNGQELANPEQFKTMIKTIREVHASKILELMVQYTLRNPVWQFKHLSFSESIGESWLVAKKSEAFGYIARINNAKKNKQIKALTNQIFESSDLVRLENYTEQFSEPLQKRNVDYFYYAGGLNYLKAFLEDYVEKEIKEICDILLIRGQWTNSTMSMEMSDALHRLAGTSEPIAKLDMVMSDDGAEGSRLRASLLRFDRDPTQARIINSIVGKNNGDALEIINEAAQALIIIGKHLKNLIEDIQKKHPELLINWREINLASKEPLAQRMVADFKRINYFVQLMHLCTHMENNDFTNS
ncbi:MAG: DUF5312 family protein [Treponema sp.]|jgi:hypothetical protein|nr:DUF5312 family protein [Treponema sp.]